jgi:hypothetical protein
VKVGLVGTRGVRGGVIGANVWGGSVHFWGWIVGTAMWRVTTTLDGIHVGVVIEGGRNILIVEGTIDTGTVLGTVT